MGPITGTATSEPSGSSTASALTAVVGQPEWKIQAKFKFHFGPMR